MSLNEQEQTPHLYDDQLELPGFACDNFDDIELESINSLSETLIWDPEYDEDIEYIDCRGEADSRDSQYSSDVSGRGSTVPSGSEILQNLAVRPSLLVESGGSTATTPHDSSFHHDGSLFSQQHAASQSKEGDFVLQQQQNVLLNIQQLKRLTESMRRSAMSRHQVQLQRQAMAAAQKTHAEKQAAMESSQNIPSWLNDRIAQSRRQLQSYANTMPYFDIVHG
jgi:hypothetical protein